MNTILFDIEDMPEGWVKTSICDFTEVIMGQSPPSSTYNENRIGLPFFQGKAEFTTLYPLVQKWCSEPKKIALKDDILMSVRAPVGSTNIADRKCCIGRGLAAIRYTYNHKFLFYFFRLIENKLNEQGTGTTFRSISAEIIKNTQLFLPPLPEQHRIAAKIEVLFSSLDKGIESLKTAQQQLKIYRQAVLKYAFEGKLTNKDVKWSHSILGKIISISSGEGLSKSNRNDEGKYLVYGGNGVTGKHSEFMYEDEKLIIGRVGVHCGNAHITKPKSWITDNAFVVSFDENKIDKKFLYFLILVLNLNKYSSSTAQPVISQGKLYPIDVSIPEKKEDQQIIVKAIESRLSVCDKIEESIKQSLEQAEALRQSILKKAFEGKLVPQNPNDEPASKLLERIKTEREALKLARIKNKPPKRVSIIKKS